MPNTLVDNIESIPQPNYVNPVTRGPALMTVAIVLSSLVFIATLLRLYTRLFIKRWFGADDVFIFIAMVACIAYTSVTCYGFEKLGWNRHIWDIPFAMFPKALQVTFANKIFFTTSMTFVRASLLSFYYRLSEGTNNKAFRWTLHSVTALNWAAYLVQLALSVFTCSPIQGYWEVPRPSSVRCHDEAVLAIVLCSINVVMDLAIAIIPIPIVAKLRISMRQRIGVAFLLSLGFFVVIAGATRTAVVNELLQKSADQTWESASTFIVGITEINVALLCACIPPMRPLYSIVATKLGFKKIITMVTNRTTNVTGTSTSQKGLTTGRSHVSVSQDRPQSTTLAESIEVQELKRNDAHWHDLERAPDSAKCSVSHESREESPRFQVNS